MSYFEREGGFVPPETYTSAPKQERPFGGDVDLFVDQEVAKKGFTPDQIDTVSRKKAKTAPTAAELSSEAHNFLKDELARRAQSAAKEKKIAKPSGPSGEQLMGMIGQAKKKHDANKPKRVSRRDDSGSTAMYA